jgi:hypothetical protein
MTWNTTEDIAFKNASSTQGPFSLRGGSYGVTVHAGSWGGGSVTLQRLGDDGATYVTVLTAFAADGYASVNLPAGTYHLAIVTATGVYRTSSESSQPSREITLTTQHVTYEATVASSAATKTAAVAAAEISYQCTVAVTGSDAGWRPGFPTGEAAHVALAAAATARANARFAAERARQAALAGARDILRNSNVSDSAIF